MREPLVWKAELWLTEQRAAEHFGVTPRSIRNWVKACEVRSIKPARVKYYYLPDLAEYEFGRGSKNST